MNSRTAAVLARVQSIKKLNEKIKKTSDSLATLKREKTKLEMEAIKFMHKEGVEKLADKQHNVTIKMQEVPVIQDFMTFWKYVRKENAPDLMQRRVSSTAWRERGCDVPGIGIFTRETLSITKRK